MINSRIYHTRTKKILFKVMFLTSELQVQAKTIFRLINFISHQCGKPVTTERRNGETCFFFRDLE